MTELFYSALITGIGLSLLLSPLGCFVVWRNLNFFGEALSHSSFLGIALALIFNFNVYLGILGVVISFSLILVYTQAQGSHSHRHSSLNVAILMYAFLALGIVLIHYYPTQINPETLLFGDVLAQSISQQTLIFSGAAIVGLFLFGYRSHLLLITINPAMAKAEGVHVNLLNTLFYIALALGVSIAVQCVGVMLVPAMLILPAATCHKISPSPFHMIILSILIALFDFSLGITAAFYLDTPTSPTIVAFSAFVWALSQFLTRSKRNLI